MKKIIKGKASPISLKKRIEEAKESAKKGEACILLLDEAEALMAERSDPLTTQEQRELCDYLLQEINEIRKKYPSILIIAATNFLDKIDSAMKRDGRLDFHFFLEAPDAEARKIYY